MTGRHRLPDLCELRVGFTKKYAKKSTVDYSQYAEKLYGTKLRTKKIPKRTVRIAENIAYAPKQTLARGEGIPTIRRKTAPPT